MSYSQISFIDIKLGARVDGSANFDIDFAGAGFITSINQAVIAAPSYTVTYNNNGSSETPPTATVGSGTVSIAPATNRTGYIFTGWNTASDGTGLNISAESNITLSANVTLYAQWAVAPTTTSSMPGAPTTSSEQTSSATGSGAASLPATGSDTSQLMLALMGLCLVGIGLASRRVLQKS